MPEVDAEEALRWLERGRTPAGREVLFIDVRTDEERAISMIPGALSAEQIEADPSLAADRTLVAYCTVGYRSGRWTIEAKREGLDVVNLAGSLLAWTHAGGPLQSASGPTKVLHVYGRTWDLARLDYQAIF